MSSLLPHDPTYRRNLSDGLTLRWSEAGDAEALETLYARVFRDNPDDPPDALFSGWVRVMMRGCHPLIGPGDFALVEHTPSGAMIATTCLLRQVWEYAGIPLPVGRPEAVASDPDYRHRGLIRAVFELIHARSDARGDLAQGITGIPYYYRQFGYEYALDLEGSRSVRLADIPELKAGEPEPFHLRPAEPDDLPFIASLYDRERAASPVSTRLDESYWRFALDGFGSEAIGVGWSVQVILSSEGRRVGYLLGPRASWRGRMSVRGLAVEVGVSMAAIMPTVLRTLRAQAPGLPSKASHPAPHAIKFEMGRGHPVYDALGEDLAARYEPPYSWYVRVPSLPSLVRHIAPVLEARLAGSAWAGYSGELKLDFYRGGLRMVFEGGKLATVEDWQAPIWNADPQAGFPPLVFLQLVFGRRSLAELRHAFPDVWAEEDGTRLLPALFPSRASWVLAPD